MIENLDFSKLKKVDLNKYSPGQKIIYFNGFDYYEAILKTYVCHGSYSGLIHEVELTILNGTNVSEFKITGNMIDVFIKQCFLYPVKKTGWINVYHKDRNYTGIYDSKQKAIENKIENCTDTIEISYYSYE